MLTPTPQNPTGPSCSRRARAFCSDSQPNKLLEARVKRECAELYPGVDPARWYPVLQEGEYHDDLEGIWIRMVERVTYVLAQHFDLQARPDMN
jgi:hypothetical protein